MSQTRRRRGGSSNRWLCLGLRDVTTLIVAMNNHHTRKPGLICELPCFMTARVMTRVLEDVLQLNGRYGNQSPEPCLAKNA